jgi:hypothetical protein
VASVTDALTPPWLVAWRERGQGGSDETATVSAVAEAVPPQRPKANVQGFVEPVPWPDDGGQRREKVLDVDHNPPRVVRVVGWQRCMTCRKPFWSDDTRHVRMCRDCKGTELYHRKPLRLSEDGTA